MKVIKYDDIFFITLILGLSVARIRLRTWGSTWKLPIARSLLSTNDWRLHVTLATIAFSSFGACWHRLFSKRRNRSSNAAAPGLKLNAEIFFCLTVVLSVVLMIYRWERHNFTNSIAILIELLTINCRSAIVCKVIFVVDVVTSQLALPELMCSTFSEFSGSSEFERSSISKRQRRNKGQNEFLINTASSPSPSQILALQSKSSPHLSSSRQSLCIYSIWTFTLQNAFLHSLQGPAEWHPEEEHHHQAWPAHRRQRLCQGYSLWSLRNRYVSSTLQSYTW